MMGGIGQDEWAGRVARECFTNSKPTGLPAPRFPRFTNEWQHLKMVLPWELNTARSPLKSGVKWPVFPPRDTRSGKSLQVWIARHRQYLGSWIITVHVPEAAGRPMRTSRPTCPKNGLLKCCRRKTMLRANASAIKLRPRVSGTKLCASNVNPPAHFCGDDRP